LSVKDIKYNLEIINRRITAACQRSGRQSGDVTLIAVTKTVNSEIMHKAYEAGLRHFGENRVQEADRKYQELADIRDDITWHMIGHLQSNKVNKTLYMFDTIHSIDSISLAETINRKADRTVPALLQVNIGEELSKSGFSPDEIFKAFETASKMTRLEIRGLMTIAPLVNNPEEVRPVFKKLREIRDQLGLKELSMGMTDDFEVAVEEGATMIRIGRAIFGERIYK